MPDTTYAGISVNVSDADIKAEELNQVTTNDLAEFTPIMKGMMDRSIAQTGFSVIEFYPVKKIEIDGYPALFLNYKRTGPDGPVLVRMIRLVIGYREISLNLSYKESEKSMWLPVISYIEKSFRIEQ